MRKRSITFALRVLLPLCIVAATPPVHAQQAVPVDLRQASLEDLMNITITSASKREQKVSQTAAAVFVIGQEDIRRSGAINIPDLLRMAPGVDVEQIDANTWAISIRGFNSRYSGKLLVLIDGRTVYTPAFSGVYWEQLGVQLDDIDRIEIIRGPGATVWGANAVNGVISIITKSSQNTKGGRVTVGGGSQTQEVGQLEYGGTAGRNGTYRVFGDYLGVGNSAGQRGQSANDRWRRMHVGFRSDWTPSPADSVMVEGELFAAYENQTSPGSLALLPSAEANIHQSINAAGGDLLARWDHTLAGGSQTSLQAYFDSDRRTDFDTPNKIARFDLDFHHHVVAGNRNDIVWGAGYRVDTNKLTPGYPISLSPNPLRVNIFNVFLQDELRLSRDVSLTLGTKLEHNGYTGFNLQPSVRMLWAPPSGKHSVWASGAKASRQPAAIDTGIGVNVTTVPIQPGVIAVIRLTGNPHFKSEDLRDYEVGYRSELTKKLSFDVATFLSFYHHLSSYEVKSPTLILGSPLVFLTPMLFTNTAHARDLGAELSLTWKANARWRISPGYSFLHASLRVDPNSPATAFANLATDFPSHTVQIRSLWNVAKNMEFDQSLYYTARLPGGTVPGHARLDLRLARKVGEFTEISVVGQNLSSRRNFEYGNSFGVIGAQSVRSIYATVTRRF